MAADFRFIVRLFLDRFGNFGRSRVAERLLERRMKRVRLFGDRKRIRRTPRHVHAQDFARPRVYIGPINLVWEEGAIPPESVRVDVACMVRQDIRFNLRDLRRPSDLITHTVFLTNSYHGPSVGVWGKKDSDDFHCAYTDQTTWVPLKDRT